MARKRGMQYIPYDYEAAYNKAMEGMHEWFIENLFQHRKKVIYALKEITAGDQFEIEIYPQFRSMDEVPPEGRTIKKDNNKAQKNLNDKNARKYVERLINENFSDRDIWMTLTYDDAHLPPDGDVDAAIKNVQKYIRRINYQRKKRGLPNAKYVYVTAYNPDAEIRWHHHIDKKKSDMTGEKHYMSGCNGMLPTMFDVQPVARKKKIHQSELPVELCEKILEYVTYEGEIVLDSFAGSGAVGVAALNKKRSCILIEILKENIEKNKDTI